MPIAKKKHFHDIFNASKHHSKLTWKNINNILHKGHKDSNVM